MSDNETELLRAQLAQMSAQITRLTESTELHGLALDSLEKLAPAPDMESADQTAEATSPAPATFGPPDLAVLEPWVQDNISSWYERQLTVTGKGQVQWCPYWFEHPEAITRLWVVRAVQLEAAQAGPEAVSVYLREHFDYHLGVLTAPTGPFNRCSPQHASERKYLPTASLTEPSSSHQRAS